jgi:hypothetical protein
LSGNVESLSCAVAEFRLEHGYWPRRAYLSAGALHDICGTLTAAQLRRLCRRIELRSCAGDGMLVLEGDAGTRCEFALAGTADERLAIRGSEWLNVVED